MSGLAATTSRWKLGAKTWRAPDDRERALEYEKRRLHELEERKVKEIRNETRNLNEAVRLQNRVAQANNLAVRAELGAQVGELRRSRSVGALGIARERQALEYERAAIRSREHQQMEADRIRRERQRLEIAAAQRSRNNSMVRSQRDQLAAVNAAILHSPRVGGMHLGGGLASPMVRARSHSFSGDPTGLHGLGVPMSAGVRLSPRLSPYMSPVGYHPPSPRMSPGGRPIINNYNYGVPASPGRAHLGAAGGIPAAMGNYGLSPRNIIVNNFPDPHRSPHMNGYASAHTSPFVGGLGATDDLAGLRGRQLVDPIVDGAMPYGGAPLFHSPGGMRGRSPGGMGMRGHSPGRGVGGSPGGMGMGMPMMPARAFVLTDQDYQDGCAVLSELGPVESYTSIMSGVPENDLIQLAVDQLVANAKMRGANGVLGLDVAEDTQGGVVARGRAVILG